MSFLPQVRTNSGRWNNLNRYWPTWPKAVSAVRNQTDSTRSRILLVHYFVLDEKNGLLELGPFDFWKDAQSALDGLTRPLRVSDRSCRTTWRPKRYADPLGLEHQLIVLSKTAVVWEGQSEDITIAKGCISEAAQKIINSTMTGQHWAQGRKPRPYKAEVYDDDFLVDSCSASGTQKPRVFWTGDDPPGTAMERPRAEDISKPELILTEELVTPRKGLFKLS